MKKLVVLLLAFAVAVGFCACRQNSAAATAPSEALTQPTAPIPTVAPDPKPTEHSDLYIAAVSQDQMLAYFKEAVLGMEYTTGEGDASLVQKWNQPICYRIEGVPTQADAQCISKLEKQLNAIEGFPGIRAATGQEENLRISFLEQTDFQSRFSDLLNDELADGAVQFWYYNSTNNIYSGRIGYRTDIPQNIRDSVIPEELVNLLGINDTVLREDSIVYQYGSEITELSAVDWAIIKLLYNPKIQCGMNAAECEPIIRELYY